MRTHDVEFWSDGIRLEGLLHLPDSEPPPGGYPAVVVCSGYTGLKHLMPARFWGHLTGAGIAAFAFDYRGHGTSEGVPGRVLPLEWVEDVTSAVTFLTARPEIDGDRIGLLGWGLGGGVVVYAGALDTRVRAVACLSGVGDAGRAVRTSRPYADWQRLQEQIAADRLERVLGGASRTVGAFEVVPLDPTTTAGLLNVTGDEDFGDPVTLQSAEAYYAFRPEEVADRIAPRPLLVVHGVENALHSIDEARSLYDHAREPKELLELPEAHHMDYVEPGGPHYEEVFPHLLGWFRHSLEAR
jgi:fermentation-respiration switch protein FrsA (DUF1100 family)